MPTMCQALTGEGRQQKQMGLDPAIKEFITKANSWTTLFYLYLLPNLLPLC